MRFIISGGGAAVGEQSAPLAIRVGSQDVVASGTVLVNTKQVQFEIANLKVEMLFESDGDAPRLGAARASGAKLTLPLYNFDNPLGSGTTQPLEVGTLAGRKLWLAFMVHALSSSGLRTVHYTFSVGESV